MAFKCKSVRSISSDKSRGWMFGVRILEGIFFFTFQNVCFWRPMNFIFLFAGLRISTVFSGEMYHLNARQCKEHE
jgi:hypothetical protein